MTGGKHVYPEFSFDLVIHTDPILLTTLFIPLFDVLPKESFGVNERQIGLVELSYDKDR